MRKAKSHDRTTRVYGSRRHIRMIIRQMIAQRLRIYDIEYKHVTLFGYVATIKADRAFMPHQ